MQSLQWPRDPLMSALQQWRRHHPAVTLSEGFMKSASVLHHAYQAAAAWQRLQGFWQTVCIDVQRLHSVMASLV